MTAETSPGVAAVMNAASETAATEDRLAAASRTLPRRRFFDDMPDKGLLRNCLAILVSR